VRPIVADRVAFRVCWSVTVASPAEPAEPIEMPFGLRTQADSRNHVLDGVQILHNLPLACSDHRGKLFRKMFPDSAVAAKYGSARIKTACVVESLADFDAKQIVCALKNARFLWPLMAAMT